MPKAILIKIADLLRGYGYSFCFLLYRVYSYICPRRHKKKNGWQMRRDRKLHMKPQNTPLNYIYIYAFHSAINFPFNLSANQQKKTNKKKEKERWEKRDVKIAKERIKCDKKEFAPWFRWCLCKHNNAFIHPPYKWWLSIHCVYIIIIVIIIIIKAVYK